MIGKKRWNEKAKIGEHKYLIVEHEIPVGFFQNALDRNEAFEKYFLQTDRSGVKIDKR